MSQAKQPKWEFEMHKEVFVKLYEKSGGRISANILTNTDTSWLCGWWNLKIKDSVVLSLEHDTTTGNYPVVPRAPKELLEALGARGYDTRLVS